MRRKKSTARQICFGVFSGLFPLRGSQILTEPPGEGLAAGLSARRDTDLPTGRVGAIMNMKIRGRQHGRAAGTGQNGGIMHRLENPIRVA